LKVRGVKKKAHSIFGRIINALKTSSNDHRNHGDAGGDNQATELG